MATEIRKEDRAPGAKPVGEKRYNGSTAIYGRSGSGKTTLAASWPKPILYFNIQDNGTDSIMDEDDIDVVDIETSDELKDQILWLHKKAAKGKLIYKTIVCDTLTQLQSILVKEVCAKKTLKKGQNAGDYGTMTMQEWGSVAGDLKAVIMDIRNVDGVESVFICQERIFNAGDEEDDGLGMLEPEVGPRLMPSVKNDLNASVSTIVNTFIRIRTEKTKVEGKQRRVIHKEYSLRVGPNGVYTTKLRKPKGIEAPDLIVDPTFRKLKKIMKGKE